MKHTDTYKVGAYPQRVCEKFYIDNEIKSITVNNNGEIFAVAGAELICLCDGSSKAISSDEGFSKVFCDGKDRVFAVSEKRLYEVTKTSVKEFAELPENIKAVTFDDILYVLTEKAVYTEENGKLIFFRHLDAEAHCITVKDGKVCTANKKSVVRMEGKRKTWRMIFPEHSDMPFIDINAIAFDKVGYLWVGSEQGLYIYDYKSGWYSKKQLPCLPEEAVYSITLCDNGAILAGTDAGAVLIKNGRAKYLPATRYAASTHVTATAFKNGVYYTGSKGGIVKISEKMMTLEEKAEHFFNETEKYFPRKQGFVTWLRGVKSDDFSGLESAITDNDGLWTQLYIAALSLWYGKTGNKKVLEAARRSIKAMLFLTKAPEIKGFTARAVRFPDEKDWGKGLETRDIGQEWHRSSDGTYEWLGETSSDEMSGHFLGFSLYYDLCANEEEKAEIREAVCNITDHIIENNGYLVDCDGKPTTWACWNPDALNHDSMWVWEKGINSLEFLAFLKVTYHMSGDEKYNEIYNKFITEHHFLLNAAYYKKDDGHSCHIDDNLAMCNLISLLRLEEDETIRNYILMGLASHYDYEKIEGNPYHSFVYSAFTNLPCDIDNAVQELKDCPMSLISLPMYNSNRRGLEMDDEPVYWGEPPRLKKPFAWDEKPFSKNDGNPFRIDGCDGTRAESGMTFLLDYWIGRYFNVIE